MHIVVPRRWLLLLSGFAVLSRKSKDGNEAKLIRALGRRDPVAFDSLMALHSESLRRFIARRVPASDIDDVLQETWVAGWEAAPSFDGSAKFRTWLFAVCFNKIRDYWRREQHRPPSQSIYDAEGCTAYIPPEYGRIEVREAMRAVWEACSPEQRELLRMYYADELTLREIGLILGRNLSTVKYQFYRAHAVAADMLPAQELVEERRDGKRPVTI